MLARWTKLRWPNIGCQRWANIGLPMFLVTLAQHWANVGVPHETTARATLAHLWYLTLGLHSSNAGMMMVSQYCANIGPLDKTLLFLLHWPSVGPCWSET